MSTETRNLLSQLSATVLHGWARKDEAALFPTPYRHVVNQGFLPGAEVREARRTQGTVV